MYDSRRVRKPVRDLWMMDGLPRTFRPVAGIADHCWWQMEECGCAWGIHRSYGVVALQEFLWGQFKAVFLEIYWSLKAERDVRYIPGPLP